MRNLFCGTLLVVLCGCPKDKPQEPAPVPSATMTASAAPSATLEDASVDGGGDANLDGGAHASNCPSSVPGATTTIKDVEGGVELTITTKEATSVAGIRERAQKLASAAGVDAGNHHTGHGAGVGSGRCPIVLKNTQVKAEDIVDGTKIVVTARDKKDVAWLRLETRERDKSLHEPGAEGAGVNHHKNCPSAVTGAATKVKDTKEGVILTITGKGDVEAEIRKRARHLEEVSKLPTSKIVHDGAGHGGGAIGRCPVVLEGETKVSVKDVPGGAEVSVGAKDAAALQKETRERIAHFAN